MILVQNFLMSLIINQNWYITQSFTTFGGSTVTRMLEDHGITILKNNTPIPTRIVLMGDLSDIPQIMETTFFSGQVESIDLPVIPNSSLVNATVDCTEDGLKEKCNDLDNFTFNAVVDEPNALCEESPI